MEIMVKELAIGLVSIALIAVAVPATAHHSFAAQFDHKKPITLKGKLTKMEWVNPHWWLNIDVIGPDGKVTNWAVEAGAANALLRNGLRPTDFPIGSELVVEGYVAKNGSPVASGEKVTFSDGRNFFLGAAGGPGDLGGR
jgi:hypothetical protein